MKALSISVGAEIARHRRKDRLARIDWTGIGLLSVGLTMMQVVLERGEEVDWFFSHWIVAGAVVASAALVALVMWELYTDEPVILVGAFSRTNPAFRSTDAQFRSLLSGCGVASTPSRRSDLAMLSQIVNNQSTMMAYNDCFWLMAVMLGAVLPFLFLLPQTGVPQEVEAVVE